MNQIELSDDTGAAALMDALFSHLFGKSKRTPRRGYRPGMERLEDRLSPAAGLAASNSQLLADYGQLPLSFEANEGQTAAQVRFLTQANGGTLFLTSSGAVLSLTKPVGQTFLSANPAIPESGQTGMSAPPNATDGIALALDLVGANPNAAVVGLDPLPGISNYFIGNDPSQWHTNIPNYSKVEYQNVYAGINLVYYGNQQQLEYEYQLAPGADPSQIRFAVQGAERLSIDAKGDLVLHTAIGDVLEHAPVIYQEIAGVQKRVSGQFVLLGNNEVGFQVGSYDATLPLVIDPVLSYSTYLGGNNFDGANGIAVDGSGDAYVIGSTKSANFPITTGAFQTSYGGSGNFEAFVTKLNASGTGLVYSTYLGGNNGDDGYGIAVDASGDAYVTGPTKSTNFPTTAGAFQTSYGGNGDYEAFVTKLNASGTGLVYSTYLGGNVFDNGYGIAVDGSGNAYVTGSTKSANFPTTTGAFQTSYGGSGNFEAFVTKLNASGTGLVYSTYLGGNNGDDGYGIAVDASGDAYVTGETSSANFPTIPGAFQTSYGGGGDAFVTKLNASGTGLVYSTYLGGSSGDNGYGIAVDGSGNAYVTGYTGSNNFPTTPGAFQTSYGGGPYDAFVTKLNATGTALVYSTYLGGNDSDYGMGIALDSSGNAYVAGETKSTNFPTTADAFQSSYGGGATYDAFVTKLNASGTGLVYSTYLGGNSLDYGRAIAVDGSGNVYVAGETSSNNFPTTTGAFQTSYGGGGEPDGFVAKFSFPPAISSVVINQDISALYNAAGQPSPGVQRSMVDDIVYTFSEPVNILDPGTDPNVFTVAVASGWTGTVPTLGWTAVAGSNGTQWAVTFSGNGVTGGSIANGAYTITVNDPASITAASDDQELSLDASGIGGATQSFYRLFGDINGDEVVNAADNIQFKQALTAYNVAFDYNDDGVVNATDNLQFKNDLSVNYSGFTATI
jgi:Beta-propeller repeat